jgi:hypothetical protein
VSVTNGAACLVARDHPESLYPICYDSAAAATVLGVALLTQRMRERGLGGDSLRRAIDAAFVRGEVAAPGGIAIVYMMSPSQVINAGEGGRRVGRWHPHLMIYGPGLTQRGIGFGGLPNGNLHVDAESGHLPHLVVFTEWAPPAAGSAVPRPDAASGARAGELSLAPAWACPGDIVSVRWRGATPAVRLASGERRPLSGESEGVVQIRATVGETRFEAGGVEAALSLHPPRMEHELRRATLCAGRASVTTMGVAASRGSDRIRPVRLVNRSPDAVVIMHREHVLRLVPGEDSGALADVPFTGDWVVVVETGASNAACPAEVSGAAPLPMVDVLLVTACVDSEGGPAGSVAPPAARRRR